MAQSFKVGDRVYDASNARRNGGLVVEVEADRVVVVWPFKLQARPYRTPYYRSQIANLGFDREAA